MVVTTHRPHMSVAREAECNCYLIAQTDPGMRFDHLPNACNRD